MLAVAAVALAAAAGLAQAAPGDLDASFDLDGKLAFGYGGFDGASAVLVQPDGRLVMAGAGGPDTAMAVTRLNRDGSFDAAFDGDGHIGVDFGGFDVGLSAALQPDGKIVVAGATSNNKDVAVARFDPDGSLDLSFDPGGAEGPGKKVFGYGGDDEATAVAVQPDGKIVVAGHGAPTTALAVTRLNPDGSFDNGFDGDGTFGIDLGGDDRGEALALQPDGKVVVAGSTNAGGRYQAAVLRVNSDGSLDGTFNGTGKKIFDYGTGESATALVVQPDGRILVTGFATGSNTSLTVTRLNSNGSFDASFDGDGRSDVDFGSNDFGFAAALQANGKIVVAGRTRLDEDFAVARLQPGGALDTTFSMDGKTMLDFGEFERANALALEPDGRIVLAGSTTRGTDIAMARLEGDPASAGGGPAGGGPSGGGAGGGAGVPRCAGRRATIVGTTRRDMLRGSRRADVIVALGGNDRISAGGGADIVCGGRGDDKLGGGRGPDRLYGGQGKDTLEGGPGEDSLSGDQGRDKCAGGPARDRSSACETRHSI